MTELEKAVLLILNVFNRYAVSEGSKQKLSKGELKKLIEMELPSLLKNEEDAKGADKLLKELEGNRNAWVDFSEFIVFVAALASACHHHFLTEEDK
ncbi:protein S100-P [Nannospalax galili]|uniref:protein S100-P n=1 Tax=Nannospalax galili TaxID=1026970 RepID=UPI0004ED6BD7|nr:protein S100-P [Nannospalax galili]